MEISKVLTRKEKNAKLLRLCGWKPGARQVGAVKVTGFWNRSVFRAGTPNLFKSLKMAHEAEKYLGHKYPDFWTLYLDAGIGTLPEVVGDSCPVECASAEQRAEAMGLAMKAWERTA